MEFKERFKGKTQIIDKTGIIGVIDKKSTPIIKYRFPSQQKNERSLSIQNEFGQRPFVRKNSEQQGNSQNNIEFLASLQRYQTPNIKLGNNLNQQFVDQQTLNLPKMNFVSHPITFTKQNSMPSYQDNQFYPVNQQNSSNNGQQQIARMNLLEKIQNDINQFEQFSSMQKYQQTINPSQKIYGQNTISTTSNNSNLIINNVSNHHHIPNINKNNNLNLNNISNLMNQPVQIVSSRNWGGNEQQFLIQSDTSQRILNNQQKLKGQFESNQELPSPERIKKQLRNNGLRLISIQQKNNLDQEYIMDKNELQQQYANQYSTFDINQKYKFVLDKQEQILKLRQLQQLQQHAQQVQLNEFLL